MLSGWFMIYTYRKLCFYPIYCSAIWFNYIRIINTRNFDSFTNSKWNLLQFLTVYYSLGCPCYLSSDNNIYACIYHFCDKNVSRIFILHLASFAVWTQTRQEWMTIFVCKKLVLYVLYVCFAIPKKTCLRFMEHVQYFDAYNSNQKKEKGKKRRKYSA